MYVKDHVHRWAHAIYILKLGPGHKLRVLVGSLYTGWYLWRRACLSNPSTPSRRSKASRRPDCVHETQIDSFEAVLHKHLCSLPMQIK